MPQTQPQSETEEEWRPVVGFEGYYSVSESGLVRSEERLVRHNRGGFSCKRSRIRRPSFNDGYAQVVLSREGVNKSFPVHLLVAEAFIGPKPEDATLIRHRDDDKTNNHYKNITYGTQLDNMRDRTANGFDTTRMSTRLRPHEVLAIRAYVGSKRVAAKVFGVTPKTITDIRRGRSWASL